MKNRIKELRKKKNYTSKACRKYGYFKAIYKFAWKNEIEPSMKVANEIARELGTCIYSVFDLDGIGTYKCQNCKCR